MFLVAMSLGAAYAKPAKKANWRMICGPEGSFAYSVSAVVAHTANKYVKGVTLLPEAGGTVTGMRVLSRGEIPVTYGNSLNLVDAWQSTGPFKKKPLGKIKPMQGIWFYPVTLFMVAKKESKLNTISDLVGKKMSIGSPGSGIRLASELAFKSIGIYDKIKDRAMATTELADALSMGVIDASFAWTIADYTSGSAVKDMNLRLKLKVLPLNDEQVAAIGKAKGLAVRDALMKAAFTQDVGVGEKTPGWAVMYGWHFSSTTNPALVYKIVKTWFEKKSELAKASPGFKAFDADPKKMVTSGMKAAVGAPVHPGAAKYYKEIGIWQKGWKVGTVK